MSYERKRGLDGMTATEVVNAAAGLSRALTDPYLPEAICRAKQLYALRTGAKPAACTPLPLNLPGGIGIKKAIRPMRGVVYAEQHRWVYPAAVATVLGVPFLLGYLIGKR